MSVTGIANVLCALDPAVWVVLAAFCLAVAIVLYAAFIPHAPSRRGGRLQAFLNFDRLLLAPVAKFTCLFAGVSCAVFGVAAAVALLANPAPVGGIGWALAAAAIVVAAAAVAEIAVRLVFELVLLLVKLVENTSALRGLLEGDRRAAEAPAAVPCPVSADAAPAPAVLDFEPAPAVLDFEPAPAVPVRVPAPAVPVHAPAPAVAPAAVSEPAAVSAEPPVEPAAAPDAPGPFGREIPLQDVAAWDALVREEPTQDGQAILGEDVPDSPVRAEAPQALWNCACGSRGNAGAYCGRCGAARPAGTGLAG